MLLRTTALPRLSAFPLPLSSLFYQASSVLSRSTVRLRGFYWKLVSALTMLLKTTALDSLNSLFLRHHCSIGLVFVVYAVRSVTEDSTGC
ncbi:hypothetical protein JAAARDRAFT_42310 [Jaapia argillacea MUCL 33604]|uniref:Uncharacterized protein n=1 Tax=Jaapia argillacea MUCL 33604 TaxID=933084 RepID=A0A067P8I5_9AGAM|nr:hypothetical protein JAAARDRAFT_42310 [Jaapia argillacea MUCL 33604]